MPTGFDRFSACQEVDGVGWYLPDDQLVGTTDQDVPDATLGTIGWSPVVRLDVPADYRPAGVAAALADLAPAVKQHLRQVRPCT